MRVSEEQRDSGRQLEPGCLHRNAHSLSGTQLTALQSADPEASTFTLVSLPSLKNL